MQETAVFEEKTECRKAQYMKKKLGNHAGNRNIQYEEKTE